jgi:hypothetical protein
MKKSKVIFSFVLLFMLVMFVSFASAGWFSDLFGKFTGRVTENETEESCQNECASSGSKECVGDGYRTCGEYDSDNCLEWSSATSCASDESCSDGDCVAATCASSGNGVCIGSTCYSDTCLSNNVINKYDCVYGKLRNSTYDCGFNYYCSGDACVFNETFTTACQETDSGKDYKTKGEVCYNGVDCTTDECYINYDGILKLREWYCDDGYRNSFTGYCSSASVAGTGYNCHDGACVLGAPSNTCTDSDGGQDNTRKGTVSGINDTGSFSITDICLTGDQLLENYCSSSQDEHYHATVYCSVTYGSDYSCFDGACVNNVTSSSNTSTTSSTDTSTTATTTETTTTTSASTSTSNSIGSSGAVGYSPSIIPEAEGEIKTFEEEIEEGVRVVKETRKFVNSDGHNVEIESNVKINDDGGSIREETRKFTNERGNEIGIKIKTEIRADGTIITDEDRSFVNRNGDLVEVKIRFESKDGSIKLKREIFVEGTGIESDLEIIERFVDGEIKLGVNLSDGNEQEIEVLPNRASEIAKGRLKINNLVIELEEVGEGDGLRAVYIARGNKSGKLLGMFKINLKLGAKIDSETGDVIDFDRPWWAFLVTSSDKVEKSTGVNISNSNEKNETIKVSQAGQNETSGNASI